MYNEANVYDSGDEWEGGIGVGGSDVGSDDESVFSMSNTGTGTSHTHGDTDNTASVTLSDGSFYHGEVSNNVPHGTGKLLHTDGFVCKGTFRDSVLYTGLRYKKLYGDVYSEQYVEGGKTGAYLVLADGQVLEGELSLDATQETKANGSA